VNMVMNLSCFPDLHYVSYSLFLNPLTVTDGTVPLHKDHGSCMCFIYRTVVPSSAVTLIFIFKKFCSKQSKVVNKYHRCKLNFLCKQIWEGVL
jgi:hypothetical protein